MRQCGLQDEKIPVSIPTFGEQRPDGGRTSNAEESREFSSSGIKKPAHGKTLSQQKPLKYGKGYPKKSRG